MPSGDPSDSWRAAGVPDAALAPREPAAAQDQAESLVKVQPEESQVAVSAQVEPPSVRPCLHVGEHGHSHPCHECIDAPSEDLHLWELVGDPGKRNGGKLLRGKLIALPQWTDVQTRHDTARAAIQIGYLKVAQALVDARSADLQKDDLLVLARLWGVRSYLWRQRKGKLLVVNPFPALLPSADGTTSGISGASVAGGAAFLGLVPRPPPAAAAMLVPPAPRPGAPHQGGAFFGGAGDYKRKSGAQPSAARAAAVGGVQPIAPRPAAHPVIMAPVFQALSFGPGMGAPVVVGGGGGMLPPTAQPALLLQHQVPGVADFTQQQLMMRQQHALLAAQHHQQQHLQQQHQQQRAAAQLEAQKQLLFHEHQRTQQLLMQHHQQQQAYHLAQAQQQVAAVLKEHQQHHEAAALWEEQQRHQQLQRQKQQQQQQQQQQEEDAADWRLQDARRQMGEDLLEQHQQAARRQIASTQQASDLAEEAARRREQQQHELLAPALDPQAQHSLMFADFASLPDHPDDADDAYSEGEVDQAVETLLPSLLGGNIDVGGSFFDDDEEDIEEIVRPAKSSRQPFFGASPGLQAVVAHSTGIVGGSGARPFFDRTDIKYSVNPDTMVMALKTTTLRNMYDSVERYFQSQREGGAKMAMLFAQYGDEFVTEDTAAFFAQTARDTTMVCAALEHVRKRTAYKLLQLQAACAGPRFGFEGEELLPEFNHSEDLAGWRLAESAYKTYLDMKDELLRLQASRAEPVSIAQQVWEGSILNHCLFQMELMSTALSANAHARREISTRDAYLAFLMVYDQLNIFFCNHTSRMVASAIFRKSWIDELIRARRQRTLGAGAQAPLASAVSLLAPSRSRDSGDSAASTRSSDIILNAFDAAEVTTTLIDTVDDVSACLPPLSPAEQAKAGVSGSVPTADPAAPRRRKHSSASPTHSGSSSGRGGSSHVVEQGVYSGGRRRRRGE